MWPQGVTTGLCKVRQHNTQSKSDWSIFEGVTCKSDGLASIPKGHKNCYSSHSDRISRFIHLRRYFSISWLTLSSNDRNRRFCLGIICWLSKWLWFILLRRRNRRRLCRFRLRSRNWWYSSPSPQLFCSRRKGKRRNSWMRVNVLDWLAEEAKIDFSFTSSCRHPRNRTHCYWWIDGNRVALAAHWNIFGVVCVLTVRTGLTLIINDCLLICSTSRSVAKANHGCQWIIKKKIFESKVKW